MLAQGYLLLYYIVYRDFITTLIIRVLNIAIIQNLTFTFSGAFISKMYDCVAPIIICGLGKFLQCLESFVFTSAIVSELHMLKWNDNNNNKNKTKLNNW